MTELVRSAVLTAVVVGLFVGSSQGWAQAPTQLSPLDGAAQAREIALLRMVIRRQRQQLDAYGANRAVVEQRAWGQMSDRERRLEMMARQDVVDRLAAEEIERLRARTAPFVRDVRDALDQARAFVVEPTASRDALTALEDRLYAIPTDGADDELLYRLSELRQAVGSLAGRAGQLTDVHRSRLSSALNPKYIGNGTDPVGLVEAVALAVREFELATQNASFRAMAGLPWAVPMAR